MSNIKSRLQKMASQKPAKVEELCIELDNTANSLEKCVEMVQYDNELTEYFRESNEKIALFDEMSELRLRVNKLMVNILK